jgi:hypothetical protein
MRKSRGHFVFLQSAPDASGLLFPEAYQIVSMLTGATRHHHHSSTSWERWLSGQGHATTDVPPARCVANPADETSALPRITIWFSANIVVGGCAMVRPMLTGAAIAERAVRANLPGMREFLAWCVKNFSRMGGFAWFQMLFPTVSGENSPWHRHC